MQLIEFKNGDMVFNWDLYKSMTKEPMNSKMTDDLKNKIFKEIQEKYKEGDFIDSRVLLEINQYAVNRIKSELKIK